MNIIVEIVIAIAVVIVVCNYLFLGDFVSVRLYVCVCLGQSLARLFCVCDWFCSGQSRARLSSVSLLACMLVFLPFCLSACVLVSAFVCVSQCLLCSLVCVYPCAYDLSIIIAFGIVHVIAIIIIVNVDFLFNPLMLVLTCDADLSLQEVFDDYGEECGYDEATGGEESPCISAVGAIGVVRHAVTCTVWGRALLACLVFASFLVVGQSRAPLHSV